MTTEANKAVTDSLVAGEAKRFNFTWAIPGGAWIEYANGDVRWEALKTIDNQFGRRWFEKMYAKQGMFTGCWINCD